MEGGREFHRFHEFDLPEAFVKFVKLVAAF